MSGLDLNDNGRIDYTALYAQPPHLPPTFTYRMLICSRTKSKLCSSDTPTTFKQKSRSVAVSLDVALQPMMFALWHRRAVAVEAAWPDSVNSLRVTLAAAGLLWSLELEKITVFFVCVVFLIYIFQP